MYGSEMIVGGAASGKTRLLKERIREFEKEGDGDILFICTTGTIRYLGLHDEFNVITTENMAISECKNKTAVEIIPDTSSVKHQKDIALLITEYSQINACENNRRTMVVVDDAPNILGTELISLLIKQPIYSKMIFTIQSPLQLEQLENMSGISLDERFSGFVYWHIHKLDKTNECFHQQNGAGWKKMKFPECFKEPEVIKKRGIKTNSNIT